MCRVVFVGRWPRDGGTVSIQPETQLPIKRPDNGQPHRIGPEKNGDIGMWLLRFRQAT